MSILEDRRIEEPAAQDSLVRFEPRTANKQRRQMLMALSILLIALVLVLLKDWQFWFPSNSSAEAIPASHPKSARVQPKVEAPAASIPTPSRSKQKNSPPTSAISESMPEVAGPSIIASQRKALPPLEVEVIAGGPHRTLQPKNNTIKVDLQAEAAQPTVPASSTTSEPVFNPAVEAPAQVRMSAETAQIVTSPVEPSYPLLAKQMKVQGAVVLQALIGRSGTIDDLRVLSGPAILSSAAMEAVKQWRFKPYFQDGRPVETQARITVNFTISTF